MRADCFSLSVGGSDDHDKDRNVGRLEGTDDKSGRA